MAVPAWEGVAVVAPQFCTKFHSWSRSGSGLSEGAVLGRAFHRILGPSLSCLHLTLLNSGKVSCQDRPPKSFAKGGGGAFKKLREIPEND